MQVNKLRALFDDVRKHDSVLWRRAMEAGVKHGPTFFVQYSPVVFGLTFGALLKRHRQAVRKNLRLMQGYQGFVEESLDVARVFTSFASSMTEAFVLGSARKERLLARVVDDEHYLSAVEHGAGVIAATAHTAGWQVAGPVLQSMHAADVLVVMRRERDARAQAVQESARDQLGVRVHYIGDDPLSALPLIAHLRRRGVVAVQMDRLPAGLRGREVELFGTAWKLPEGPLRLAAASGAPIVPVFTRRLGFMEYEVVITKPIFVPSHAAEPELDRAAQQIAHALEGFLSAHPTQWFHFE